MTCKSYLLAANITNTHNHVHFTQTSLCVLPAHEVFQDGAFPCALAAHYSDLRQLEAVALTHGAQGLLESVDQRDQLLHPAVAHRNGTGGLPVQLLCVFLFNSGSRIHP